MHTGYVLLCSAIRRRAKGAELKGLRGGSYDAFEVQCCYMHFYNGQFHSHGVLTVCDASRESSFRNLCEYRNRAKCTVSVCRTTQAPGNENYGWTGSSRNIETVISIGGRMKGTSKRPARGTIINFTGGQLIIVLKDICDRFISTSHRSIVKIRGNLSIVFF